MRSLIITVAGTSTRFNRDTKEDVLKCLYYIGNPHLSLLYQQVYKAYDSVDEIIIVGGYKFDNLAKFVNEGFLYKERCKCSGFHKVACQHHQQ